MSEFKICFIGASQSGKTELIKKLIKPEYINDAKKDYIATTGLSVNAWGVKLLDASRISVNIWDISGQIHEKGLTNNYVKGANLALYCIDLSATDHAQQLQELHDFHQKYPEIPLILVGTKGDVLESPNKKLQEIQSQLNLPETTAVVTSARQQKATALLEGVLVARLGEIDHSQRNSINAARDQFQNGHPLHSALNHLNNEAQKLRKDGKLSDEKLKSIGYQAMILAKTLMAPERNNIEAADIFVKECNNLFPQNQPQLLEAVLFVVVAVLLITLIGAAGFGIGFGFGLLVGAAAAKIGGIAFGITCVAATGTAAVVTANNRFKSRLLDELITETAETAKHYKEPPSSSNK